MSENRDAIRADIEATRARLETNVDAVADKVTPSNIVHRQTDKVKDAVFGVKDKIMGSHEKTASSKNVHSVASAMRLLLASAPRSATPGSAIADAPAPGRREDPGQPARRRPDCLRARGCPVSSLIPPSQKEREAAEALKPGSGTGHHPADGGRQGHGRGSPGARPGSGGERQGHGHRRRPDGQGRRPGQPSKTSRPSATDAKDRVQNT